jgi:hypothetical protein
MNDPKYSFLQSVTTSHPGGNHILVSGPLAPQVSIHGGQVCLGPGFPANAAIGRAANLVLINRCRVVPGISDLDCLASQAEFTYCFAEPAERVANRGISPVRPREFEGMDPIPVTRTPEDIEIVVAGGQGGHSAVILPWALHSEAIVEPVTLPDGSVAHSVEDFRVG